MKKPLILFLFMTLLFISQNTFAQDIEVVGKLTYNTFDLKQYVNGEEVSIYNDEVAAINFRNQAKEGKGYYFGLIYWFNNKWGIEGGFDRADSTYDGICPQETVDSLEFNADQEISTQELYGPYLGVVYSVNQTFKIKAGVLKYYVTQKDTFKYNGQTMQSSTTAKSEGEGALLGGELVYHITENLLLNTDLSYRIARLEVTKAPDYNAETKKYNPDKLVDYNEDYPGYFGKYESKMDGFRLGISLSYLF
jgi:hypothetical protein